MKRVIVLLLCLSMIFALAACGGKVKCDVCGETKSCKSIDLMGDKVNICSDCEKAATDLANDIMGGADLGDLDLSALLG